MKYGLKLFLTLSGIFLTGMMSFFLLFFSANEATSSQDPQGFIANVSTDSSGNQSMTDSYLYGQHSAAISAYGKRIVFESLASDLVPGDSNNATDVFMKNSESGETIRLSTDASGNEGYYTGSSQYETTVSLSADGRYAVFSSRLSPLVPEDTTHCSDYYGAPRSCTDIFRKDTVSGEIEMISVDPAGHATDYDSIQPSISGDGRFVSFASESPLMTSQDLNGKQDIFVRDTVTGTTTLVSTDAAGNQANDISRNPKISSDGKFVVFFSLASNLVADDSNGKGDIFVKNLATGEIFRPIANSAGYQGPNGPSSESAISGDGRYVAMISNDFIYVKDLSTGTTKMVEDCFFGASDFSLSADGKYLSYISSSGVHISEISTGVIKQINLSASDQALSPDGHYVVLYSSSSEYSSTDVNQSSDYLLFSAFPDLDIQGVEPAGWISSTSSVANITLTDDGSGIDGADVAIAIDDDFIQGCHLTNAVESCEVSGLGNGRHLLTAKYNTASGKTGYGFGYISIDTAPPMALSSILRDWVNYLPDKLEVTFQDAFLSGIDRNSMGIYLDGSSEPLAGCTFTTYYPYGKISCPVSLAAGHHTYEGRARDLAGNPVSGTYQFDIDLTAPTISSTNPNGELAQRNIQIEADFFDGASGIDSSSVKLLLNDVDVTQSSTIDSGHISYLGSGTGLMTAHLEVKDIAGNLQQSEWQFTTTPAYYFPWYDTISGRTWMLTAMPDNTGDNSFSINLKSSNLTAGGEPAVRKGNTVPNYFNNIMGGPVKIQGSQGPGLVSERSLFGNSFEEIWGTSYDELDSHYYWPIYDGVVEEGMRNWILAANPPENREAIDVSIQIFKGDWGGSETFFATLAPGETITPEWPGLRTGPVEMKAWRHGGSSVNPDDARKVIASQRVLFNGSFNEMPGIPASRLSPVWTWTWYDNLSPGTGAWICAGNPNNQPIYLFVLFGNSEGGWMGPLKPNETAALTSHNSLMTGPVYIMACFDRNNCIETKANIFASQRSSWGPSFSEIAGATAVHSQTAWTWYDNLSAGSTNWVLMSNVNEFPILTEVKIAGAVYWTGWINPNESQTPNFPGVMGGPVEVKAWTDASRSTEAEVFASQRVLWNGFFNEIVGKGI